MNLEQWQTYSLAHQLGNVGAEAARMVSLKEKGSAAQAEMAFVRTLELLDLTIKGACQTKTVSELTRLREIICGFMKNSPEYNITGKQINNYFIPFAIMARK